MMIDYDFVIFLSENWDVFFRRYLLSVLADQSPVSKMLCVDRPVCLVTMPFWNPARWIKQVVGQGRLRKIRENLFVYRPWVFVHDHMSAKLPITPVLNREWLRRQLKVVINYLGLRQDRLIVWIYDPFQEEYLGLLNQRVSVYECYDEYTTWAGVPFFRTREDLMAREKRILGKAHVTFVVSEALYERKHLFSQNIHVVPNAADVAHFSSAQGEGTTPAEDMVDIPHPIMGYLGNLTDRVDFVLLLELARAQIEWSLVFVGGTGTRLRNRMNRQALAELRRMENVHFLGPKPYEQLPSYLKAFDVCLIPYVADDPFNIHCSPLKLYEYLATGKPIVSTNLPAVQPFDSLVRIAQDADDFERQVAAGLEEQDEDLRQRRLALASKNSWEQRASQMLSEIDRAFRGSR